MNRYQPPNQDGLQRVRLSEWARDQGISRITAYRMLKRGILPVPSERSPTGRWYVLLPPKRSGRTAIYARATPGPNQIESINSQLTELTEWAASHRRTVFTVVREVADPFLDSLPRLRALLADPQITEIAVHDPAVVGVFHFQLLVAALAPQGRTLTVVRATDGQAHETRRDDLRSAIIGWCKLIHGPRHGLEAARRAIEYSGRP